MLHFRCGRADGHSSEGQKVVGERLALLARGHVYGETLLGDVPMAENIRRDGSRTQIAFQNAESGLKVKGCAVEALHVYRVEMYGVVDRREEIPVTADAEGEKLVILLPEGTGKVSVEFAQTRWYRVNLYNQADIPAIPFEFVC